MSVCLSEGASGGATSKVSSSASQRFALSKAAVIAAALGWNRSFFFPKEVNIESGLTLASLPVRSNESKRPSVWVWSSKFWDCCGEGEPRRVADTGPPNRADADAKVTGALEKFEADVKPITGAVDPPTPSSRSLGPLSGESLPVSVF